MYCVGLTDVNDDEALCKCSVQRHNISIIILLIKGALLNGLEIPSFSTKPAGTDNVPSVSAQELYSLLRAENVSRVLVLDCRPHSMFLENRINRPSCINIPAELLDSGLVKIIFTALV